MHSDSKVPPELGGVIRKVRASEVECARAHLLRLDADARRLRFGHDVGDAYVANYALSIVAPGNLAFGYFNDGHMHALAELRQPAGAWGAEAEAAFSVEREFANKGLATVMMGRIICSARNRGVRRLYLYCLADNAKMQAIAAKYRAELKFEDGSVIADIAPTRPDCYSMAQEFVDDRVGYVHSVLDYQSRLLRPN